MDINKSGLLCTNTPPPPPILNGCYKIEIIYGCQIIKGIFENNITGILCYFHNFAKVITNSTYLEHR